MKKFLIIATVFLGLACKKDNDSSVDKNCIYAYNEFNQPDGGVRESIALNGCGEGMPRSLETVKLASPNVKVFYKGQVRPLRTFLVVKSKDGDEKRDTYIRYESGQVPQATQDKYTKDGFRIEVKQATGLERANW